MSILQQIREKRGAFIIAEVGVNYYDIAAEQGISVLDAAKLMIDKAAAAGADAVKFQTYKAGKIASKSSPAYWDRNEEPTSSQFELFSKFDKLGEAEYRELAGHCESKGTVFLSTPFDFESADFLEPLMPIYKISSSDLTNLPFIEHLAQKQKPLFLSTGAATIGEIEQAMIAALELGNRDICLLHCVLAYPTNYSDANLNMIRHLGEVFPGYLLGYSDHTRPDAAMLTTTAAYIFGAKVIEKHFTLDKTLPGNDHYHAMDPADLEQLVANIELYEQIRGKYRKEPLACEQAARKQARRSIVALVDIAKGDTITRDNIAFKRPGTGISPALLETLLGRTAKRDIPEDALITWEDV
jgi:N-acetylneuraminate synthase